MSLFSIGLSALNVNQQLLQLTGQNVSNANTPGYHRQVADLTERTNGLPIGTGVELTEIKRIIDDQLEQAVNNNASAGQNISAQLNGMQQVQDLLSPSSGSLNDLLQAFFNQAVQLSSNPDDLTQRQVFLSSAAALAQGLNSLSDGLTTLQSGLYTQAQQALVSANALTSQIAGLNGEIQTAVLSGDHPNDLMDQRDQLIANLSSIVNIQTVDAGGGVTNVLAGGIPVVMGSQANQLSVGKQSTPDNMVVVASNSTTPLTVTDGQLAGLLNTANQAIPSVIQQLNALSQQLISGVNEIQATSIPLTGSYTQLNGENAVSSSTVPLAQAGLAIPPQAGTLQISVTDNSTGARTTTSITIDPATQSLQDIATALSAIPHVQAVVNAQTNTLSIMAQPGFSFDFAGTGNTDSAGLLSALGLNTFFQGKDAATINVNPNLIANPSNLALSQSGATADGTALTRLAALQDASLMANGTETLQQFVGSLIGSTGSQVQSLTQQQTAQQAVAQQLQAQQQSVSGVSSNEELVKLMNYQQAYQLAAHFLSVVDQTYTSLLQIT
jgi:flagellar hook-associated protein FlgK